MGTVTIDDNEVTVGDDEHIDVIQAAQRIGISIPHYCSHNHDERLQTTKWAVRTPAAGTEAQGAW